MNPERQKPLTIESLTDDFLFTCSTVSTKWELFPFEEKSDDMLALYDRWASDQAKLQAELEKEGPKDLNILSESVKKFNERSNNFLLLLIPMDGKKDTVN